MSVNDLATFDYSLPEAAIAQTPVEPRDSARMLCSLAGTSLSHRTVQDLPDLCSPGDVLVVNDTKVRAARLLLKKTTGGSAEVLLLEHTGRHQEWKALVKPGRRLPPGTILEAGGEAAVEILDIYDDGSRLVKLLKEDVIETAGAVPLPPYIHATLDDPDRYQTIFANRVGSVAAPTAGLHLTAGVIEKLKHKGVSVVKIELQVGLGTFKPIVVNTISEHVMHAEEFRVEPQVWEQIRSAKRVIAVGTTVVRTLESVAAAGKLEGSTELFIRRGFDWQVVDRLLTNFHVPKSSLLVMIDAFVGSEWKDVYREALAEGYRFLSFGDCMLLDRISNGG